MHNSALLRANNVIRSLCR